MPIGAIFEGQGISQAQYDQARKQVLPDNAPAPGMLYHAGGPTDNGWCVIEVWESRDALDRFFQEKLSQALQQAGINVQPRFFEVVNIVKQ
jgi:quinol monooxygenase YgiN